MVELILNAASISEMPVSELAQSAVAIFVGMVRAVGYTFIEPSSLWMPGVDRAGTGAVDGQGNWVDAIRLANAISHTSAAIGFRRRVESSIPPPVPPRVLKKFHGLQVQALAKPRVFNELASMDFMTSYDEKLATLLNICNAMVCCLMPLQTPD